MAPAREPELFSSAPRPFARDGGGDFLDDATVRRFRRIILDYYADRGRRFPWRETGDPYAILVSELMLQQTQTERVVPKYHAFLGRFPNVAALAGAPLRDVLGLWQGLGYNRRARSLWECARTIVEQHDGKVPRSPEALETLPGIGAYTSRAVCAFAYRLPVAFIETNIRRVVLYFFFDGAAEVRDRELLPVVERTMLRSDPRRWYYALMDYGVALRGVGENPNRRSAHYARQGKFEGSSRQIRGRIVRALSEWQSADAASIAAEIGFPLDRVADSLEALKREGLLVFEDERYRIADAP